MVMSWYYSKNGMQLGPVAAEELLAKSKSGEVLPTDLVWKEGLGDWKPLGQVPEFAGSSATVSFPPAVPMAGGGSAAMQQPAPYSASQYPVIPNYLWQSIVVTVLCCLPFGVVSIVYAAKVDGLVAQGDLAGANAASKSAKTWAIAGVGSWAALVGIYIIFVIIAVSTGAMNTL